MRTHKKSEVLFEIAWFTALALGLFLLYQMWVNLGFSSNVSKGLSLLLLLSITAVGIFSYSVWIRYRGRKRFKKMSLDEKSRYLEEQIQDALKHGIITHQQLEETKFRAKADLENRIPTIDSSK